MRGSRKLCQRGSNFIVFFFLFFFYLFDEGEGGPKYHYKQAIIGPSETPFKLRANDGSTLNAGLVGSFVIFRGSNIARKPYIFVIFQWVGSRPPVPLLDPRRHCSIFFLSVD